MAAKARFERGARWVIVYHRGKRRKKWVGQDRALAGRVEKQIQAKLVLREFEIQEEKERAVPFDEFAWSWFRREILLPYEQKESAALPPHQSH